MTRHPAAVCGPPRRPALGGFTLLEMVVVVSIAALMIAVVPPLVSSVMPGVELKAAARELSAALRFARDKAVSDNQPVAVRIDIRARQYRLSGMKRVHQLPEELDIKVYGAASESPDEETGGFRFFPDGSSTGGRVTLAYASRSYRVDVDWLLGRVTVSD